MYNNVQQWPGWSGWMPIVWCCGPLPSWLPWILNFSTSAVSSELATSLWCKWIFCFVCYTAVWVPSFAELVQPLTAALRRVNKNAKQSLVWTSEMNHVFRKLSTLLVNPPVLSSFRWTRKFGRHCRCWLIAFWPLTCLYKPFFIYFSCSFLSDVYEQWLWFSPWRFWLWPTFLLLEEQESNAKC